jgi:hypothetical protein
MMLNIRQIFCNIISDDDGNEILTFYNEKNLVYFNIQKKEKN